MAIRKTKKKKVAKKVVKKTKKVSVLASNKTVDKKITQPKGECIEMVGRRKTSVARVKLFESAGDIIVNEYSMKLNLLSAVGAGLVGLVQIFIEKKTSPRQLFMYGIAFPFGAYFLTDKWVPSGFEFALLVFEILTVIIMAIETIYEFAKNKKKVKIKIFDEIKESAHIKPEE